MALDVQGALTYSKDLSGQAEHLLTSLRPGGKAFIHISFSTRVIDGGEVFTPTQWLAKLAADTDDRGFKIVPDPQCGNHFCSVVLARTATKDAAIYVPKLRLVDMRNYQSSAPSRYFIA
ncbi:MAG: hypothetical protein ACI9BD_000678 [Candidatus Marinamargulisbacteria bacterium]|jgi:hypothetical protein